MNSSVPAPVSWETWEPVCGGSGVARRGSFVAALNRMNRAMLAQARANERSARVQQRLQAKEDARLEVLCFENLLEALASVHRRCSHWINWEEIANAPEPKRPVRASEHEKLAQRALDDFSPGFFDRLFNRAEKKRAALAEQVQEARLKDERCFSEAQALYELEFGDWESNRELALAVIARDPEAITAALDTFEPWSELSELGARISVNVSDDGCHVEAEMLLDPASILPTEIKCLLASGKLSVKKMPKGQQADLLLDLVAGCALRMGTEIFAATPVDMVFAHVTTDSVNPATGRRDEQVVLSIALDRETLESLVLSSADPSDCLVNFTHHCSFSKSRGFAEVERIRPKNFIQQVATKFGTRKSPKVGG